MTEGTKSDIDKLLNGTFTAAVVACVSPEKAKEFPKINGFKLLKIAMTGNGASCKNAGSHGSG